MKCALAIALVAAVVCSAYAAPVGTKAPNWPAVDAKINEIEAGVTAAVQQVKTTANNDNAAVGRDIGVKLDAAAVLARQVLDQARAASRAQTLTEAQAKQYFAQLQTILTNVQNDIRPDVEKLSAAAQTSIRQTLADAYTQAEVKANELYALLRALILAPNWPAVDAKINEIEAGVTAAVQQVKTTANNDNAAVGRDIGVKLDAAAVLARQVLDQARAASRAQTLTEAQAKQYFAQLQTILTNVQNDIRPDVEKLSAAAQTSIRQTLADAYTQAEVKANELYALLRALLSAPNWPAVDAKINEIEAGVTAAVQQVKTTANNDNAAVGRDIGVKLDAAAVLARQVLDQARAASRAQTLTEAQAKQYFAQLQTILTNVQNDIRPDVEKLSAAAQTSIRQTLADAYTQAEVKANELYALLRA